MNWNRLPHKKPYLLWLFNTEKKNENKKESKENRYHKNGSLLFDTKTNAIWSFDSLTHTVFIAIHTNRQIQSNNDPIFIDSIFNDSYERNYMGQRVTDEIVSGCWCCYCCYMLGGHSLPLSIVTKHIEYQIRYARIGNPFTHNNLAFSKKR